jgi:PAS domain S-box-containing protein
MLRERISEPPVNIQPFQQRVQWLYQQGALQAQSDALLNKAFEELAHALDALHAADQVLHRQREEWLNTQVAQELEYQRYKDLFEHAPAGYLVTSIDGVIRQANAAALAVLETSARAIVGRSVVVFVPEGQRRAFRAKIAWVVQATVAQEWVCSMCSWEGAVIEARLTVGVQPGSSGRPLALYWLIRVLDESGTAA